MSVSLQAPYSVIHMKSSLWAWKGVQQRKNTVTMAASILIKDLFPCVKFLGLQCLLLSNNNLEGEEKLLTIPNFWRAIRLFSGIEQ